MLKSVVFFKNEKIKTYGDLLAVARHCARRRENAQRNPPIVALIPVFEVPNCYCAVYIGDKKNRGVQEAHGVKGRHGVNIKK